MSGQSTQQGLGGFSGPDGDAAIDGLHAVGTSAIQPS
jgi:hypothetical protein